MNTSPHKSGRTDLLLRSPGWLLFGGIALLMWLFVVLVLGKPVAGPTWFCLGFLCWFFVTSEYPKAQKPLMWGLWLLWLGNVFLKGGSEAVVWAVIATLGWIFVSRSKDGQFKAWSPKSFLLVVGCTFITLIAFSSPFKENNELAASLTIGTAFLAYFLFLMGFYDWLKKKEDWNIFACTALFLGVTAVSLFGVIGSILGSGSISGEH
jgi:hypothetical protein